MSTRTLRRKVECPFCHQTAEIASLGMFLYAHHCPIAGWWYSNGLMWSNSREEVVRVARPSAETQTGEPAEAGQDASQVLPNVIQLKLPYPEASELSQKIDSPD